MQPSQSQSATRWGQERRLEFIEFRLLWDGRINRGELVKFFGISVPQASLDIARYTELAPKNLIYDKRERAYRFAPGFQPKLIRADASSYLTQLIGLQVGTLSPALSFIGWQPPCDVVRLPTRVVATEVLVELLSAMRNEQAIEVSYQSMRRSGPTRRWIEPHATAFDGARWHLRAWCDENKEFRDFVVSRIESVGSKRARAQDPTTDEYWHRWLSPTVVPLSGLSKAQRQSVIEEYGMVAGELVIPTRAALVHYLVRHLQLDRPPDDPNAPPIQLANPAEIEPYLLPNKRPVLREDIAS